MPNERNIRVVNERVEAKVSALLNSIRSRLDLLSGDGVAEVLKRLDEQAVDARSILAPEPRELPVLKHLDRCLQECALFDAAIAQAIAELRPHLQWRQSRAYSDALLGPGFMDNYGWCEIIGPNGFFPGDDFLLGLLNLGPNTHYRDHAHPAPELYVPLTSGAGWRKGGGPLTPKAAGAAIWHSPQVIHATSTTSAPLLALWCWTRDTATPARLVQA